MAALLSVSDALARVLDHARPLPTERLAIGAAHGRVLAEHVRSLVDLPPFASSSMDGFAVRSSDLPGTLKIVGRIAAGRPESRDVRSGEAIEISTGGVVPEGADAVIPIERVVVTGGEVEVPAQHPSGDNIRSLGGDVRAGATVLEQGARLTPARLGALAACGIVDVAVHRVPRVAIAVTGTELRPSGTPLERGQIYESNGIMLESLALATGALVDRLAVAEDTERAHRSVLETALTADIVLTSGGVSVGPHDLVRRVEAELGVKEVFWGVAMRPGKPIAFGIRGATLVFGLPGNPVSSLVGFLLFVRPALLAVQGDPDPAPPFLPGILSAPARQRPERDDFVRARLVRGADCIHVMPTDGQESHMIARTTAADAIVEIPRGEATLEPGTPVRYLVL